jgi:2-polyprenyl-3-methyl-5-hydroxy-6-metoxy-1,4-benzoquinol methylase
MVQRPTDHDFNPDATGAEYDAFYEHHFFQPVSEADCRDAHRKIARVGWALDIAKEVQPKTMVDLGCLDGSLVLTLCNHIDGLVGVGVDLSQEGIDLANDRAAKFELPATFNRIKLEDYLKQTSDNSLDMVTLFEVIEHVEEPDEVVAEIHRVLKPGGTILVSTPAFESPHYGMDDEQNKCHVRLYTTQTEDYEAINKFGHTRRATSMPVQLQAFKDVSMDVFAELIHARATK